MAKKTKQKPWYSQWWAIILIILVTFYFFQFLNNQFFKIEEESEKDHLINSLEERGYENVVAGSNEFGAFVDVEHWERPPSRHVSTILHNLYGSWENASSYSIRVTTKGESCAYFIKGDDYKNWRIYGDDEDFTKWQEDIYESEDCY